MTSAAAEILSAESWRGFFGSEVGEWIITRGMRIVLLLIGAVLASRFITWSAHRVTRRLEIGFQASDALVRSEASKHRQAVASVISWMSVALLCVVVAVEITSILDVPIGSLVGPAAVIGGALGFGAQKVVQDLLAGFFIIAEKQYGFGDLVQLSMTGAPTEALGTVVDVTLRVTKLRTANGEVFTVPNGNIVRSLNLSKDWARAVVDIPIPTTADLSRVNEVLHQVCQKARDHPPLRDLLLDQPSLMGVESIEVGTVNLRMVARTLPGKQFEVGRLLRADVVRALARVGVVTAGEVSPSVTAIVHPEADAAVAEEMEEIEETAEATGRVTKQ
ncbi:MAG TPA: mechanosensitive ion channel family protein [Mycobacterium sp.]